MPDPVIHFEIVSKNADKLHSFYSDVFDWKIDANNPMNYGIVDNGARASTEASEGRRTTAARGTSRSTSPYPTPLRR